MNYDNIFSHITDNSLVLTPNNRLSAILHQSYSIKQQNNQAVWPTLPILPLSAWIKQLFDMLQLKNYLNDIVLLNPQQEKILWKQIIKELSKADLQNNLLNISQIACHLEQAWTLIHSWNLSVDDQRISTTTDGKQLIKWLCEFKNKCIKNNWVTQDELIKNIQPKISEVIKILPKKILLTGFVDVAPSVSEFFSKLSQLDIDIKEIYFTKKPSSIKFIQLKNIDEEIETMARWAKKQIEINPSSKVICVDPTINENFKNLERAFSSVLNASNIDFNISSGKPLILEPIINSAINFLEFVVSNTSKTIDEIELLFSSPFFVKNDFDWQYLSKSFLSIRKLGNNEYDLKTFIKIITKQKCLKILSDKLNQTYIFLNQSKTHTENWAKIIYDSLIKFCWPGERTINSREFQALQQFQTILTNFSSLKLVKPFLSAIEAISILKNLASETIFQPQGNPNAQIQILGVLEATGLIAESIWWMGLDNTSWPEKPNPNPFIPVFLQKKLNMPHASFDRELEFSKSVTNILLNSANEIIVSCSQQDEILLPSSLISHIHCIQKNDLQLSEYTNIQEKLFGYEELTAIEDNIGVPITENTITKGGAGILKLQALCPFQAYATYRLFAKQPIDPNSGLSPLERGTIIHLALELFWTCIKSHRVLCNLSLSNLDSHITQAINKAIESISNNRILFKTTIDLEKKRLEKILFAWLAIEKNRKTFSVLECEKRSTISIGNLSINIKIDRIDKLEDSTLVLIDYKTSKSSPKDWLDDRPEEPQLPLYAITLDEQINTVTFAQLRLDDMKFNGISQTDEVIPGKMLLLSKVLGEEHESWDFLLAKWKTSLENLAKEFCDGIAHVNPKNENTCRLCCLKSLCRSISFNN